MLASLSLLFFLSITAHTPIYSFFFFNDTATTEIYTLSLHDALPIYSPGTDATVFAPLTPIENRGLRNRRDRITSLNRGRGSDRKSTRLNSSHQIISYAVFCLKKKKTTRNNYDGASNDLAEVRHRC